MRKGEKGAISTLVLFTVLGIATILIGSYITVTNLRNSQLKSSIEIQKTYSDNINEIDNIYTQLMAKKEININYNPNGTKDVADTTIMQTKLSVSNIDEENVNIYYAWSSSNCEEPAEWTECKNDDKLTLSNINPGTYYLWSKVDNKNTKKTLKKSVSQEFVISNQIDENLNYIWQKKYEWGLGTTENLKYYQIGIDITNLGDVVDNWEITFKVQPGIVIEQCNVWCASLVEANENIITMKNQTWNNQINKGSTLNLEFILAFDNEEEMQINDLKFNGKEITCN